MNEREYFPERFEEHRTHLRAVAYRMLKITEMLCFYFGIIAKAKSPARRDKDVIAVALPFGSAKAM